MAGAILTQERLKEVLNYDTETGFFTWVKPTNKRIRVGQVAGCVRSDGYVTLRIDGAMYFAHRLAWLYAHGEWPSMDIDHENGNPSDNRMSNLRLATDFENMQNLHRPMSHNKTSRILGVSFNTKRQKWVAQIRVNGVTKFIGRFDTVEEAKVAYGKAKSELHPQAVYGREYHSQPQTT